MEKQQSTTKNLLRNTRETVIDYAKVAGLGIGIGAAWVGLQAGSIKIAEHFSRPVTHPNRTAEFVAIGIGTGVLMLYKLSRK